MPWIQRIAALLAAGDGLRIAFQPIVDLVSGAVAGWEALSRFPSPRRGQISAQVPELLDSGGEGIGPAAWFAMASYHGLLAPLETLAARLALARLPDVPDGQYLAVNVSPSTVLVPAFVQMLTEHDLRRVVLEIVETEPTPGDYRPLLTALAPLRRSGAGTGVRLRLAVDDVGAEASMAHVLALGADVVKIDLSVVRGIHHDPGRQALAHGFADFARVTGASVVAEGIEDDHEAQWLRQNGITLGQGYRLGRPGDLPTEQPAA